MLLNDGSKGAEMTDADIGYLSAAELTTRYRDRSLSPVEAGAALERAPPPSPA